MNDTDVNVCYCIPLVEKPMLVVRPLSQNVTLLQTATFTCFANGYNVSFQWKIHSSRSFPNKVTGIKSNTLVIPNVKSSDNDVYTCVVSNEGGIRHIRAQLTVTGMSIVIV